MNSSENKYKLNQDDKEYIITTLVENQLFKIMCQDSTNSNTQVYIKCYSLNELLEYDIFKQIKSIEEANTVLDKLFGSEKAGITESNGTLTIELYLSEGNKVEFLLSPDAGMIGYESRQIRSAPTNDVANSYAKSNTSINYNNPTFSPPTPKFPTNIQNAPKIDQSVNNISDDYIQQIIDTPASTKVFYPSPIEINQYLNTYVSSGIVDSQTYSQFLTNFTSGKVNCAPNSYKGTANFNINQPLYNMSTIIETKSTASSIPAEIKTNVCGLNSNNSLQNQYQSKITNQQIQINNLKNENRYIKKQLNDINLLRRKLEEMEQFKNQIPDLNNLNREQITMKNPISTNANLLRTRKVTNFGQVEEVNEKQPILVKNIIQQIAVKGDIIRNAGELVFLIRKMSRYDNKLRINLLYKATVDSDKAQAFHQKCDDAKSTLVLIETTKGKRFGGFTTCSWSGNCIDKKDENAFIFSLDNMKTYDIIPGEEAIGCFPKFGPVFLGCQIRIYDNAFSKGGTTYESGLNYNTTEDFELT